ncbi:MAG: S8 family serine peptidase [Actinomycetota bacterium]|nr:S8 family serine peptidase [Actinomycetota bacterium]
MRRRIRRSVRVGALALVLAGTVAACDGADGAAPAPAPIDVPDAPVEDVAVGDDASAGDGTGAGGDPLAGSQWGLTATRLPEAWATADADGVTIAIVDTGVDLAHPDLADRLVGGIDLVDGDDEPDDPHGHGTHVAGIAAATAGNGIGIAGAAPGASIMPIRVLDADGAGDDATIAAGIDWAVDHGADVVNLSLGESGFASRLSKGGPLNAAIRRADAAGAVVVAAAGNDADHKRNYRVGVPVLVVNASTPDATAAAFTNTGDARAVAAPGVGIVSTVPPGPSTLFPNGTDGNESLDGTSMAAPLVSGLAALLVAEGLGPDEVRDTVAATAADPNGDPALGNGIVDAAAAVAAAAHVDGAAAPDAPIDTSGAAEPPTDDAPAPTGSGEGAAGSVSVVPAEPVELVAPAGEWVRCSTGGRRYAAAFGPVVADGRGSVAGSITWHC